MDEIELKEFFLTMKWFKLQSEKFVAPYTPAQARKMEFKLQGAAKAGLIEYGDIYVDSGGREISKYGLQIRPTYDRVTKKIDPEDYGLCIVAKQELIDAIIHEKHPYTNLRLITGFGKDMER